jgi:hypothetical protein
MSVSRTSHLISKDDGPRALIQTCRKKWIKIWEKERNRDVQIIEHDCNLCLYTLCVLTISSYSL